MKRAWSKKKKILYGTLALYILLYLFFYPNYYLVNDEHHYIRGAYLLSEGKFWIDNPLQGYHFVSDGEHYFPRYVPGMYLLLLPFVIFGLKSVFLSGLLLHILGFFIFIKILKLLKIDTLAALLYLVYPPFVYYSATAFADYPFVVFVLLGWYFYLKKKPVHHALSGACFGFSFLLKPHAPVVFAVFFLIALLQDRKKFLFMALGAIPFALINFGYSWLVYGSPLAAGHAFFDQGFGQGSFPFITQNIIPTFIFFLALQLGLLLVFYPLMAAVIYTTKRKEVRYASLITLAFLSAIIYTGSVINRSWMLVVQYRYILPVCLFLLPEYYLLLMDGLRKFFSEKTVKAIYCLFIIGFFLISATMLAMIHSASQRNLDIVSDITERTDEGTLILGSGLGEMMNEFYGRDYLTVDEENEAQSYKGYKFTQQELQEIFNKHDTIILISEKKEEYPLMFTKTYRSKWMGAFFREFNMNWYVIKNATTPLQDITVGGVE